MRQKSVLPLLLATMFAGGAIVFAAEKFLYPEIDIQGSVAVQPTYVDVQLAANDEPTPTEAEDRQTRRNRFNPELALQAAMAEQLEPTRNPRTVSNSHKAAGNVAA